ncbi:hypothetical protein VNI00_010939 [Paramarasmius palmivorus]|uniref:Uncharacterized protein n=1 Tax=Paramarasmius palmivorus TaxID=297713 RepID=A0AAW0CF39_9AGAR
MSDELWSLIAPCWEREPKTRPTAEDLLQRLIVNRTIAPAEDWNDSSFTELQRNVTRSPLSAEALDFLIETLGADVIEKEKWATGGECERVHTEDSTSTLEDIPRGSEGSEGGEQELLDTPRIEALQLEKIEGEKEIKDREQDIVDTHSSIDALQAELDERASELAEKERRLADLESQLSSRAAADYQRNRSWLEANYKEAKAQVNEEHRRVHAKEKVLQALYRRLQNQQKALQEQEVRQNAVQRQLKQREADLEAREKRHMAREIGELLGALRWEKAHGQLQQGQQKLDRSQPVTGTRLRLATETPGNSQVSVDFNQKSPTKTADWLDLLC